MAPINKNGPRASFAPTARRQGRGGHAFDQAGDFLGNITGVDWDVEAEQVDVLIPGSWRNAQIPGAEARRGTIRYQDVDDFFRMLVYAFFEARRIGEFGTPAPLFNVDTLLAGGPLETQWALRGCRLYGYAGGYSNADDVIERELAFTFDTDFPVQAFQYTTSAAIGYVVYDNLNPGGQSIVQ